jgi:WhiB family transcriptional regulator, redox-sensing transcriptional regulator
MKRLLNVPPPRPPLDTAVAGLIRDNWRLLAACRSTDPELFVPVSSTGKSLEQAAEAKAVCACCLVRRQCLAFALGTRQPHGIWGGMTEEERKHRTPDHKASREAMNPPATA